METLVRPSPAMMPTKRATLTARPPADTDPFRFEPFTVTMPGPIPTRPTPVVSDAALVTAARGRVRAIVADHGDLFTVEISQARNSHTDYRVACQCLNGHGVAGLPWRGWISTEDATITETLCTIIDAPDTHI